MRRDIVYTNEANKVKLESFRQVTSRAGLSIIDYNPDGLFWGTELITEQNFIQLTFEDNEYLSESERQSILEYKEKGYNEDETIKSEYWANIWRVYGLGEIGSVAGRIYNWRKCSLNEYLNISVQPIYGVDWGAVDPMGVIEVKYYDGTVYVHEINYQSENEIRQRLTSTELMQINGRDDEGLITWLFSKWKVPQNSVIVCDSNRPSKILSLRNGGWEYAYGVGAKTKLLDRIGMLSNLNIVFTETSTNIDFEQQNYKYSQDKFGKSLEMPEDANNHLIDPLSYVIQHYFNNAIIKNV